MLATITRIQWTKTNSYVCVFAGLTLIFKKYLFDTFLMQVGFQLHKGRNGVQ